VTDIQHFGVKGMHWGRRKMASGSTTLQRPRAASPGASREEKLVSRALDQAHNRVVGKPMAVFVTNIPKFNPSTDAKVNDVLNRALSQGLNRVEAQAGQQFIQGLTRVSPNRVSAVDIVRGVGGAPKF
jgi:hypothetical protein